MENIELQHHGTKGMRWGIRRYQNSDGSLTPAGKKRYGIIGSIKERSAQKKKQKQRAEALEKARETKKTKAEEAAEKKRVLESGTAAEVMKYKGQLSNKELADAYSRLNYERMISDISARDIQSGADKVDSLMTKAEKVVGAAQKGLDTYNKAAKIVNAVSKADLPTFEGNKKTKEAESALNKLVKSGTAEEITKQFGKLSSQQLKEASSRFTYEDNIKKRANEEKANRESSKNTTNGDDAKSTKSSATENKTNKSTDTKSEKVSGTVEGEGTSRSNIKNDKGFEKKEKPSDYYDPIDVRFVNETPMSTVRNSEQARIGQSYINELFLLEDKSR